MPRINAKEKFSKEEQEAFEARLKVRWDDEVANSRLSLPFSLRLPMAAAFPFIGGMVVGSSYGYQLAGLRFRAENSHRLPTTATGWYLYHKAKNYQMAYQGIKEGVKLGSKLSFWTTGYFLLEDALDDSRGRKDFISSVLAGLVIAGGFSLFSECVRFALQLTNISCLLNTKYTKWTDHLYLTDRLDIITAARTAKKGLGFGLAFGLTQDALGYARGRPLAYVDWISKRRCDREQHVDII